MANTASFAEAASVAASSLRGSKMRSFLTLLGIILATTTLIAVMSVINGMNKYIAQQVSDMGVDGFRVRRIIFIGNFDPKKFLEFQFIKDKAKLVREIGMEAFRGVSVRYGTQTLDWIQLSGISPNMGVISNIQTASALFISEVDDKRRLPVVFIGEPDVSFEFENRRMLVQCKRVLSELAVARRIGLAAKQLDRDLALSADPKDCGVIAISISRLINPGEKMLTVATDTDLQSALSSEIDKVIERHAQVFRGVKHPKTGGHPLGGLCHAQAPLFPCVPPCGGRHSNRLVDQKRNSNESYVERQA